MRLFKSLKVILALVTMTLLNFVAAICDFNYQQIYKYDGDRSDIRVQVLDGGKTIRIQNVTGNYYTGLLALKQDRLHNKQYLQCHIKKAKLTFKDGDLGFVNYGGKDNKTRQLIVTLGPLKADNQKIHIRVGEQTPYYEGLIAPLNQNESDKAFYNFNFIVERKFKVAMFKQDHRTLYKYRDARALQGYPLLFVQLGQKGEYIDIDNEEIVQVQQKITKTQAIQQECQSQTSLIQSNIDTCKVQTRNSKDLITSRQQSLDEYEDKFDLCCRQDQQKLFDLVQQTKTDLENAENQLGSSMSVYYVFLFLAIYILTVWLFMRCYNRLTADTAKYQDKYYDKKREIEKRNENSQQKESQEQSYKDESRTMEFATLSTQSKTQNKSSNVQPLEKTYGDLSATNGALAATKTDGSFGFSKTKETGGLQTKF